MTLDMQRSSLLGLVNREKGLVERRIFSDEEIYQLELERIFARAWNFMCHDSQIPNPGDFFMTFIGEDRVIVVRDNDGQAQVLVNSCRHRGNAVCRAEEGHATSFMCTYHGWTYDLKGNLVGVPGFKEVYHEELDRENWGLIKAAQVESYKGFIFANMDEAAPALDEYLGEIGQLSIDMLAKENTTKVIGGIQKYTLPCNWKLAADNVWDFYHPAISHASQTMAGWRKGPRLDPYAMEHIVLLGEYGHALSGPQYNDRMKEFMKGSSHDASWREADEVKQRMGPVKQKAMSHPHVFPNFWITFPGGGQVSLRLPKGPMTTEIWFFTFEDIGATEEDRRAGMHRAIHNFGPAGMLEQDDGENWGESTRGSKGTISSRFPLHYAMGLNYDKVVADETGPPHVETGINEHAQLWHYTNWSHWMAAESWDELRATRPEVPRDVL